ncbi:MAG: YqhA family protein [Rhodovarius sp.]|nr:YqhA family protein [Rhodovarius sp.]MCX7933038.1 YqhA family protein [Rhodovarius sp.]MDW8314246.1 YqhA family protein [Rhodovarius sp.]
MGILIDRLILASRWLLVVFFLGLALALGVYAIKFLGKLLTYAEKALGGATDTEMLLGLLYLVDSVLVASLVVMVIIASHDSLVSPLVESVEPERAKWVQKLNPGNLKLKLSLAIVGVSSISLLQSFLEVRNYTDRELGWTMAIHALFVACALALGVLDRMEAASKGKGPTAPGKG